MLGSMSQQLLRPEGVHKQKMHFTRKCNVVADDDAAAGKGHRSKAVDNKPRKSILVKLR